MPAVEFLREARDELRLAAGWYRRRSPDAARSFLVEVKEHTEMLAMHPEIGAVWDDDDLAVAARRVPLRRFPYLIFNLSGPPVCVIAVAHGHRNQGYWRGRLLSSHS